MFKNIQLTLRAYFPNWTDEQIAGFIQFISSKFKNIDEPDIINILNESIEKFEKKYPYEMDKPQLLRVIFQNDMFKEIEKKSKTISLFDFKGIENSFSVEFGQIEDWRSIQKIEIFCKLVKSHNLLRGIKGEFFDAIIHAAKSLDYSELKPHQWERHFWNEVKKILNSSSDPLTDNYFRKVKERVIFILNSKLSLEKRELLSFLEIEKDEVLETLLRLFDFIPITTFQTQPAYRFSVKEMEKMIWLKKEVFEHNGFSFEPNCFPEIYYCDFSDVKHLFWAENRIDNILHDYYELNEEKVLLHDNNNTYIISPDYFGCYLDYSTNYFGDETSTYIGKNSHEGRIILFKDRIEKFCLRKPNLTEENVRFVVLMHELGHWMSHWSKFEFRFKSLESIASFNWLHGYHFKNTYTHEGLAQLITYWCCKGNYTLEKVLLALSPKNALGEVDGASPYGGYECLKHFSKEDILKKLVQLRTFWMVNDLKMNNFLQSDFIDMVEWINATKENNTNPIWMAFVNKEINEWYNKILFSDEQKKINYQVSQILQLGNKTANDLRGLGF